MKRLLNTYTNYSERERAFTLIELVVTIALMVVLVSLVVANFSGTSPSRALAVTHSTLVSDIRKMQSFAVDSRNVPSGTPASEYQVAFDLTSTANQHQYALNGYDNAATPNKITLSTQHLPANIYIPSIVVVHAGGSPVTLTNVQLTVTYTVPYARMLVTYTGSSGVTNEADDAVTVNLTSVGGAATGSVTANAVTGGVQ